jgi:MFS family permease
MTGLSRQTLHVALVQSASTLPVLLLVLPCGAVVDMVDRKRLLMATQLWLCVTSLALAISTWTGLLSAEVLLMLVFANGIGLAMRWPAFITIMPEVVARTELPQALALHAMAMNGARVVGPLAAGLVLAIMGGTVVFAACTALSLLSLLVLWRCRYAPPVAGRAREPFLTSIRVGVQHVAMSSPMRRVLMHIFVATLQVFSLIALLPAAARGMGSGGSGSYTLLMSFMGTGAVAAGFGMPRLRDRFDARAVVALGCSLHSAAILLVVVAPSAWIAAPAMFVAGAAWLAVGNALTVFAQRSLPDWVRARGMAIYMMAAMAGSAAGAALFGAIADRTGVRGSLEILAATAIALLLLLRRWPLRAELPCEQAR